MILKNYLHKTWVQLFLFLIIGGVISAALKFEVLWDFANYHYYNPWAFLNNNPSEVMALAGFHSFFNPVVDVPLYLLIEYFNDYPNLIYFVQGMSFGLLAFIFFRIEKIYFAKADLLIPALIIGLTGYAVFFQIGTSSNEMQIAVLIMFSFFLLVKGLFANPAGGKFLIFIAGLLAGAALGLKYTAVIYCASLFLSMVAIGGGIAKRLYP